MFYRHHFSSTFPIHNGPKQENASFLLFFILFIFLCNLLSGDVSTRGSLYVDFWNTQEIKDKTYDKNFQTSIEKNNTVKMTKICWEREH
jgi:hypothetical protein